MMGSHSSEAKRRKRKERKRKKRALKRLEHWGGSVESTDLESSALGELDTSSETTDHNPPSNLDELSSAGPGDSEDDLFALLDRVAERKEKFWDLFALLDRVAERKEKFWEEVEPEIRQLESYRDAHPSLVLDQD